MDLTWEQAEENARKGLPGYRTIHKLLKRRRFDK
jgi:hypothetical protein